jgi:hypothetical protein
LAQLRSTTAYLGHPSTHGEAVAAFHDAIIAAALLIDCSSNAGSDRRPAIIDDGDSASLGQA